MKVKCSPSKLYYSSTEDSVYCGPSSQAVWYTDNTVVNVVELCVTVALFQVFKRLFRDGLDIQKERIRELRTYAKEQRQERARRQQQQLDSLEN